MISFQLPKFNHILFIICLLLSCQIKIILAQESNQINPLTNSFNHELVPKINRALTVFEKRRIRQEIEALDGLASQNLSSENIDEAFNLWYEAINLSRFVDLDLEMNLIATLGAIAWKELRGQDVDFLQERLLILEKENSINNQIKLEFLPLFIKSYESIHDLEKLIVLNQQKLAFAREEKKDVVIRETLNQLGKLYLAKFDYLPAKPIYQELLEIAQIDSDYLAEGIYLQKLAEINQALVNPKNSVRYKEVLADNYQQNNNLFPLSRLKISIGDDYKALDNPQLASQAYQEAFSLALSLEQYAIAGDALKQLGKLYQQYQELDSALKIYQELIKIEANSYNYYGLMNTYDFIGTIYSQKQDYAQALGAFQKALSIARELQYKENYFIDKINQLENLENN